MAVPANCCDPLPVQAAHNAITVSAQPMCHSAGLSGARLGPLSVGGWVSITGILGGRYVRASSVARCDGWRSRLPELCGPRSASPTSIPSASEPLIRSVRGAPSTMRSGALPSGSLDARSVTVWRARPTPSQRFGPREVYGGHRLGSDRGQGGLIGRASGGGAAVAERDVVGCVDVGILFLGPEHSES